MRLFVAIELPEDVKDYLYNLEKGLDSQDAKIKWVAKKHIHLTLKFLGYIDDSKVEDVKGRLREVRCKRFRVALNRLGWFPGGNSVRVIWVDVKPEEDVMRLQKEVDSSLLDMFSSEQRFYSHLTLGRVKSIKDKAAFLKRLQGVDVKKIEFDVDEFILVESKLRRDGPVYSAVERFKLS